MSANVCGDHHFSLPPAVGGAVTYFGDVVPELARRDGIEQLTVLTERIPGQPHCWSEGWMRLLRYLPTRVSLPQPERLVHAATYPLTQVWFAACLPRLVRRHGADLIHFHTRYRGRLSCYTALRRSHVPVIADLRGKMTDPAQLASVADRLLCCGKDVQRFAIDGGFPAERTTRISIRATRGPITRAVIRRPPALRLGLWALSAACRRHHV